MILHGVFGKNVRRWLLNISSLFQPVSILARLDRFDLVVSRWMKMNRVFFLRSSLGIIFIWFGILKPLGVSSAEPLVLATSAWLPVFHGETWLFIIGWWEVVIGVTFLFHKTIRIAIGLLALQMFGTFLPLVLLPEISFQPGGVPFLPSLEGQYIMKNLVIIAAAMAIGGSVREGRRLRG